MLDLSDPQVLAEFYAAMLGWEVHPGDEWWTISGEGGRALAFQRVAAYRPPQWPRQDVPQQMHVDVDVDDLDAADAAVLELGATKADTQPGTAFRVLLDPAGHPFCLCAD